MHTRKSILLLHIVIFCSILNELIPNVQSRECPLLLPLNERRRTLRSFNPNRGNLSSSYNVDPRIIWGSDLSPTLLPYVAALFIDIGNTNSFVCTAIIVAPRILMTAAHCIVGLNDGSLIPVDIANYIVAYFGARKTSTEAAEKRNVISRIPHPKYVFDDFSTYEYDVAYLLLDEDVPSENKFMKINSNNSNPVDGSAVRNIGYGVQRYYSNQNVYSGYDNEEDVAQQVDFPVTNYTFCDQAWTKLQEGVRPDRKIVVSRNFHICAGYLNGGCSSWYAPSISFLQFFRRCIHLCTENNLPKKTVLSSIEILTDNSLFFQLWRFWWPYFPIR